MKRKILLVVLAMLLALSCLLLASCSCEFGGGDDTESGDESGNESQSGTPSTPGTPGTPGGPSSTAASIENVYYLRVSKLGSDSVTVKFNVYASGLSYDIRYSEKPITEDNWDDATVATNVKISGSDEITAEIKDIAPSLEKAYYIGVRSKLGNSHGKLHTLRAGGNLPIEIDYTGSIMNVYHGESLRSFEYLFDEQWMASERFYFPETNIGVLYNPEKKSDGSLDPNGENNKEGKVGMTLRPIVDMEYMHYVTEVKLYYMDLPTDFAGATVRWSKDEVDFQAADSEWDGYIELTKSDFDDRAWNVFEIDSEARYIQVVFKDGQAPNEVAIFGYQCAEGDPIAKTRRTLPKMTEMMGMCGFVSIGGGFTPIVSISCTTVMREYHNFGWSYNERSYPGKSNLFNSTMGNYDVRYREFSSAGILVVPCIQWADNIARKVDDNGLPIKEGGVFVPADYFEKFDPDTYFLYADNMFAFAARYGTNKSTSLTTILRAHSATATADATTGMGYLEWLEFGNEPNGEDQRGMVPYQLAALQSATYDGHEKTMVSSATTAGYHLGAVNGDPDMKVAMAGLAGIGGRYITSMCYWLKANRSDGSIAMDAFNFHCYFSNTFYMNNTYIQVGVSPEYYNMVDAMSNVIEFRDKYYPDKEVWITEFGWDTNPSYETMTAAHAYAEYDSHQVQAMWLVRAYLLFSSCGIDKATMYMCEDVSYDVEAVGKYGTCGVVGFDKDGEEYYKDSYYYLYTLKNTLGEYRFARELDSGSDDVWVYEYKTDDGKTAYAVWCPTMDGTKVPNFELPVSGSSATLVQAVDLDKDGVSSDLTVSGGKVKINVSENPVYVIVD